MNKFNILLTMVVCLFLVSCGYTILKMPPEQTTVRQAEDPNASIDIAIIGITGHVDNVNSPDDTNPAPSYVFYITVTNLGPGSITHPIKFAWSDNQEDMANRAFPNLESAYGSNRVIAKNDTVTFSVTARHKNYLPGRHIRFIAVTRNIIPAEYCWTTFEYLYDHLESRYDNNIFDYTIK